MIASIVRRVVEDGYDKQNRGDFAALGDLFAADAVFEFLGDTPFGGERRGRDAIVQWFDEVGRDFGRLTLTAQEVAVSGGPWNMRVIVRFRDHYQLITGDTMTNHGFQFLRIAWGKVKEDRILVDLDVVHRALELITAHRRERAAG